MRPFEILFVSDFDTMKMATLVRAMNKIAHVDKWDHADTFSTRGLSSICEIEKMRKLPIWMIEECNYTAAVKMEFILENNL